MAKPSSRLAAPSLGLTLLLAACGGRAPDETADAGGGDDAGSQGDSGAGRDATAPPEGCASKSGYAVCGGPHDCFPASARGNHTDCWDCAAGTWGDGVALCYNATNPTSQSPPADDGQVYVEGFGIDVWTPVPFDVGQLFADDGAGDRVRYADWSAWTGAALPAPTSCPQFSGFSICGGNCGTCSAGEVCIGRSPLHPYGLCVGTQSPGCSSCPSGQACLLAFKDPPADQILANSNELCFPPAACQAIASNYPGGATCH
jgi:hypothetical protein